MPYRLFRYFLKFISYIPFTVLYVISDVLAFVVYHIARYRRKIVRRNLTECFPDKNPKEIRRIEKGFYRFFTDNIVETCKMAHMSPEEMSRRMKFTNIDEVNTLLRNGRSVSLFLGHYGNWEWISSMPLHLCKEAVAAQIYHKLRNKEMDKLMLEMRGRMGATNVEMGQTARFITRRVAAGEVCIVGFIADQSPHWHELHHFLPFLHHDTPVMTGPEKITKHYDFEARYVNVRRVRRGYYEAEFVDMADNPRSMPDFELTGIYYRMLADSINRQPELYLWSHNRFKPARQLSSPDKNA